MQRDALRYELRALGPVALVTPLLVVAGVASFVGIMALGGADTGALAKVLTRSMELLFPLAAGMIAATVVASDPGVEWQLTLPTPYRATIFRRLGIIVSWASLVALADVVVLRELGRWLVPEAFVVSQLTWLAPLLAFTALGGVLALLLRNRSASAGLLGGIFAIEIVLHETILAHAWTRPWFLFATSYAAGADFWLGNRLTLIALAALLFGGVAVMLGQSELLLVGGDA